MLPSPSRESGSAMISDASIPLPAARRLAEVVRGLAARGLCPGTGGNFSLCLDRDPLRLLMTPSGANKGRLEGEDLLLVGPDGGVVDGSGGRPSAEALLHVTLVETTGAASVLHTHSVANTLLGEHFLPRGGFRITGYEMLKGLRGITSHEALVQVPVLANSQNMIALAGGIRRTVEATPEIRGLLLAGHGLYAWGDSLEEAERHVEIFEFLFECVLRRTPLRPLEGTGPSPAPPSETHPRPEA